MRLVVALLVSVALGTTASPAGAKVPQPTDTVDPSVPTQLPRNAIPHHYLITVTPHAQRLTFDSTVSIDLDVVKPTRDLVLNAADLAIRSATLRRGAGGAVATGQISLDADTQTVTIAFPRILATGSYRLTIAYSGKINTQANGLFALDYRNKEGKAERSLFTQFEAADARRFVPSWDEPDYKATFELTARVPAAEMTVSNMPPKSTRNIGAGLKEVRFATTPTMSSYLLFFATGDFDRIAKRSAGREVGVVVSRGNGAKGKFALDSEAQILPYYDDYFGTPFPLPKLDNVGGPGQSQFFGAMENWGAIFTFEQALLDDPAITSEAGRQHIFVDAAHEMAHQWFGDLVTMAWWDDIWLNEGFASWMESRATRHFHPDWGADVDQVASREAAMELDSFATSHPIVQHVRTVEQANQAFDTITYQKGESVISMLEGFVGPDIWRRGIQDYIRRHAYQNTRTPDLWAAVEGAGGRGVTAIATDFTTQPGVPLIIVGPTQCAGGRTVATLTQSQFSDDRRREADAGPLSWRVPVRATAGGPVAQVITQGRITSLAVQGCGPLLINPGQTGYFRTLYATPQAEQLRELFPQLSPVDQYGTMQDALALSMGGYQPMSTALDLIAAIPATAHANLVERAVEDWAARYDDMKGDEVARGALAARIASVGGARLREIGFVPRAGEAAVEAVVRPTLITELGKVGDPTVVNEANRLFASWIRDRNAIPGSIKSAWLGVAALNANAATWAELRNAASGAQGQVERATLYRLLGTARDEALARQALDLALTPEPGKTTSAAIISAVAKLHPGLAIDFVLSHLAEVNSLIDLSGRSRFVAGLAAQSDDPTLIPKLVDYGNATFKAADRKPIEQAVSRIRWRLSNRERIRSETAAWLRAHG